MRRNAPAARLTRFGLLALLGLALLVATGCVPVLGPWSGSWRSQDGALLVLNPSREVASVAFDPDSSMVGHFIAGDNGHATVEWLVFPSPESAALGARSTLTRRWNQVLLTSQSEQATYTVCVFPPYNVTNASMQALVQALRLDPTVVGMHYVSKDEMLVRYKKVYGSFSPDAPNLLDGGPLGACLLVSVKSSQDPVAFVRRVQQIPIVAARLQAMDASDRFVVISGPRGERTIVFTREGN